MSWVDIVVSILSGLAVCIPLVVQLVNVVRTSVKEKNWSQIVAIVLDLMKEAETLFSDGATKKAYVMSSVESAAKSINYNYDDVAKQKVSDMIDAICATAKIVNAEVAEENEAD